MTEDFSNYWTAVLYFRARNGTFKRVPTMANQFLEPANGGITVYVLQARRNTATLITLHRYYIAPYDNVTPVTAFRKVGKSHPPRSNFVSHIYRASAC
jgi:hypothetical protein